MLDAGECISCFLGFCTPLTLEGGSVFLDFVGFTLSGFGLEGVYFLVFLYLHSLALDAGERIS